MEKYSLLPINPQQLTPAQTALQKMSEKHPDFEIQAVTPLDPQILNICVMTDNIMSDSHLGENIN